jgi:hypothetical protein
VGDFPIYTTTSRTVPTFSRKSSAYLRQVSHYAPHPELDLGISSAYLSSLLLLVFLRTCYTRIADFNFRFELRVLTDLLLH